MQPRTKAPQGYSARRICKMFAEGSVVENQELSVYTSYGNGSEDELGQKEDGVINSGKSAVQLEPVGLLFLATCTCMLSGDVRFIYEMMFVNNRYCSYARLLIYSVDKSLNF